MHHGAQIREALQNHAAIVHKSPKSGVDIQPSKTTNQQVSNHSKQKRRPGTTLTDPSQTLEARGDKTREASTLTIIEIQELIRVQCVSRKANVRNDGPEQLVTDTRKSGLEVEEYRTEPGGTKSLSKTVENMLRPLIKPR